MKSISQFAVSFKIHNKSVEVQIVNSGVIPGKKGAHSRGKVTNFSYKSERRMRLALEDTAKLWDVFAVLTYPGEFPCDGAKVKRDVQALKRWLKRQGIKDIFWGLEFQKRGAPHINLLLSSRVDKDALSLAWFNIVGSGDERHLKAGTQIQKVKDSDAVSTYVIGYQYKRWQKDVPEGYENVGRFWGCTRSSKSPSTYTYSFKSYEALESFLKPVVTQYQSDMDKWSKKKEKPYTWTFRGNSFVMWSGSEFVNKLIEGGCDVEGNESVVKESKSLFCRGSDDVFVSQVLADPPDGSGEPRRVFLINQGSHV